MKRQRLRRINQQMPTVTGTSMNQKEVPAKEGFSGGRIAIYTNDAITAGMATKPPTSKPERGEMPFIKFPAINPAIKGDAAPITTVIPMMTQVRLAIIAIPYKQTKLFRMGDLSHGRQLSSQK